jgi:hypothetical protein
MGAEHALVEHALLPIEDASLVEGALPEGLVFGLDPEEAGHEGAHPGPDADDDGRDPQGIPAGVAHPIGLVLGGQGRIGHRQLVAEHAVQRLQAADAVQVREAKTGKA